MLIRFIKDWPGRRRAGEVADIIGGVADMLIRKRIAVPAPVVEVAVESPAPEAAADRRPARRGGGGQR